MIKRVEVNYRGIFQKNLGKYIGSDIAIIANRMGKTGFSNGRYSDAPERNGISCKYFAYVSPDLSEEELEAECGAKMDIDEADVSVVLDDTMVKGVEPWGWHGVRSINEKIFPNAAQIVVTRKSHEDLLQFIGKKDFDYRLATLEGDASFAGLWVNKDDLTRERVLGAIAAVDPDLITIEAVEEYLLAKTHAEHRSAAARQAYEETLKKIKTVTPSDGIVWPYTNPVLPKWNTFADFGMMEGAAILGVPRGFKMGPRGQNRNEQFKRGTTKSQRPVVRFDLCIKCTLCWLDCPDECFDPTEDGLYDVDYEVCVGCHKCASVCPVPECIVMVDELKFMDTNSPWEHFKKDREGYIKWAEEKKGVDRFYFPQVTGTGFEIRHDGKSVPAKPAK